MFSDFSQYLRYCMQRRWKNTKAAIFISKKLQFLSQIDLFSLFLCLCFLCFFVSHNTKAYIFLVSLYCMQRRWKSRLQLLFLSEKSTSMSSFSLFFWFMVKFFRLRQPSQTCSFFLIPIFLGFYDFSQDKSFNFSDKKFKFFYFVFWLLTIPLLLYAEKVEEDTKAMIFIYKKLRFLSQTGLFSLIL